MQFLTKKEVADLLGVSERTVTRRVKEGKLKVKRKGRRVFFPKEQFENVTEKEKDTFDIVLETLQKELDEKNKQIAEKDKQIAEKDRQLEGANRALNNQQGLTKDITDKILMLPEGNRIQRETPEETPDRVKPRKKPREKPQEKPEEKPEKRWEKRENVKKQPKKQSKKGNSKKSKKKGFFNNIFK